MIREVFRDIALDILISRDRFATRDVADERDLDQVRLIDWDHIFRHSGKTRVNFFIRYSEKICQLFNIFRRWQNLAVKVVIDRAFADSGLADNVCFFISRLA
uniref:ORF 101 n=1 Tax=Lactococcus phage mv4 TaxID=12392 RepID=Q9G0C1_BPMV4|nr:ORF 101 [Lactobacillus phage mv4]